MEERKNSKTESLGKESIPSKENIPISEEELSDLVRRAKTGDRNAQTDLIIRFRPKIIIIAKGYCKRYSNQGVDLKDLICAGEEGVFHSIRRYDENRDSSFFTCAEYGIRESIRTVLPSSDETVHVPKEKKALLKQIKDTIEEYIGNHGREPGIVEIAHLIGIKPEEVSELLESLQIKIEIDKPNSQNESMGDTIENPAHPSLDDNVLKMELSKGLQDALGTLTPREQDILCSSSGFKCERETDDQISDRLGISAERVRQLREKAFAKLRQSKQSRALLANLRQADDTHRREPDEDIFASGLPPEEIKERVLREVRGLFYKILVFEENIKKREKEGKYYVIGAHYFESGLWKILIIYNIMFMYIHLEKTDASLLYNSNNYRTGVNRLKKLKYIFDPENEDFNEISDILGKFQDQYNINIYILQLYFVTYLLIYLFIDIGTLFSRETSLLKKDLRKAQKHLSAIRADFCDPRSVIGQDLTQKMSGEVDYYQNMIYNIQTLYSPPAHKSTKSINILLFYYGLFIKQETNKYHWKEVGKLFEHLFHKFDPRDQLVYDIHGLQREFDRTKKTKIKEFVIDTLAKLSQLKPPRDKFLQPALNILWYLIDHDEKIYQELTKKIQTSFPEGSKEKTKK